MTHLQTNNDSPRSTDPGRLPEREASSGISVLIVGAGVAGLLACLECWRQGHEVRIIERSASRLLSGKYYPEKSCTGLQVLVPDHPFQATASPSEQVHSVHSVIGQTWKERMNALHTTFGYPGIKSPEKGFRVRRLWNCTLAIAIRMKGLNLQKCTGTVVPNSTRCCPTRLKESGSRSNITSG